MNDEPMRHDLFFLGGEWRKPAGPEVLRVFSPATEEEVGHVPLATTEDVDVAVTAACAALEPGAPWTRTTMAERAERLTAIAAGLEAHREELALVNTLEGGQPLPKSRGHVDAALQVLRFYAELGATFAVEDVRTGRDNTVVVRREPIGVVGSIVPWNAPLPITFYSLAPALLAGCAVVLKPAPETPLHAQLLARIVEEVGLPAGVVNVLPADRGPSQALVEHPGVDKISFTGSTATGRLVGRLCGEQLKAHTLELGGKSAAILLEDADLARCMPMVVGTALTNSGEACVGQTRTLVPRSRYAEVVDAFVQLASGMSVGDPLDESTAIGPLITGKQREKVESYIAKGRSEGARLVLGGGRPADLDRGWFVEATVFADVDNGMSIAQNEIFGPVSSLIPYDTVDDAVALADDSRYGLSGTVWTEDLERGLGVARRIRTGNFGVNHFNLDPAAPFGGYKESGVGRQLGVEGLAGYQEYKSIQLPRGSEEAVAPFVLGPGQG
jgi:betaine-aldehyde dehydrogenase